MDDGTIRIDNYTGLDTIVRIPNVIDGKPVTEIGKSAFEMNIEIDRYNGFAIDTVCVPSSIWKIDNKAFYSNIELRSLKLSEGLKEIGDDAFAECWHLRDIRFPSSLKSIGNSAFYGVSKRSWTLPEGLEVIGENAFDDYDLCSVLIPASVIEIGCNAFVTRVHYDAYGSRISVDDEDCKNRKGLTIYAPKDSKGEEYALKNLIRYITADHCPF